MKKQTLEQMNKECNKSLAWCGIPVIPALRKQKQEDGKVSLDHIEGPFSKNQGQGM
jgi:hypothetical protein